MPDHSNDGQNLIEAYRNVTVPDTHTEEAVLQRLLDEEPARPTTGRVRRLAITSGLTVLLAAMVLLAVRGIVATVLPQSDTARQQAPYRTTPIDGERSTVPHPETRQPASRPGPEAEPVMSPTPEPTPLAPEPAPLVRRRPSVRRTPSSDRTDSPRPTINEEARLLSAAQAALRDGQAGRALEILSKHIAEFPNGAMQLERDSLQAVALCQDKQHEAGRALAQKLARQRPHSRYEDRIRRACDLDEAQSLP